MSQAREWWAFWQAFVASPRSVGAVAPSSSALARLMVEGIDWSEARAVVECGPGTGAFTGHILARLRADARLIAVEIHPGFAARLEGRFPGLTVVRDSVRDLPAICAREGIGSVDAVLSSLPWASFPAPEQRASLDAIAAVLRPGGRMATFAYLTGLSLPAGRRLRRLLRDRFAEVRRSRTAWRNLPPAFVYRCRR